MCNIGCVAIPVFKKANRLPLSHYIGIPCWLIQTITMCYMVSYTALIRRYEAKVILAWLICSVVLAALGATLGGWLMKMNHQENWINLGSAFLVLSFMLVVALITVEKLGLGGM